MSTTSRPTEFRFAVLAPAGQLDVRSVPDTFTGRLTALQQAVGGDVEPVPGLAGGMCAWVNEDGHSLGLPINPAAVPVLRALGVTLAYPVIVGVLAFTGRTSVDVATLTDAQMFTLRTAVRHVRKT